MPVVKESADKHHSAAILISGLPDSSVSRTEHRFTAAFGIDWMRTNTFTIRINSVW